MAITGKLKLTIATAALLGGFSSSAFSNHEGNYVYIPPPAYEYGWVDPYAPTTQPGYRYSNRTDRYGRDQNRQWREQQRENKRAQDFRDAQNTDWDIRNNAGTPLWSQGDTYRGVGPNYDPAKDVGQYSGG